MYIFFLLSLDLKTLQADLTVIKNVHFLSRQIVVPHIDFPTGYLPVYLSLVLALSDFPEWNLLFVLFSLEYGESKRFLEVCTSKNSSHMKDKYLVFSENIG